QENIRKSEYHFTWEEKLNAYCTPNRKNNLRFFYTENGFAVEPRTTQIPIGEFDPLKMPDEIKYRSISNWKVKFDLDKKQVGNGKWQIVNNKAEYITEKITFQYINNDEGMRQNFIVHQPLSKSTDLKINFSVKTKLRTVLKNNHLQFLHKKIIVLNYEDLKVWDATGKSLSASFRKKSKGKYCIEVDTKDAVYPITIDPISTTPSALLESNQVNAQMGFSVASAGDVNGDGYSDVITGVPGYDNPQTDEGAAFIFHGSATGVSTTAAAMVESNVVGARLGISVSTAGDVNGDGFSDIVVGANTYSNAQTWEGAAYIYHGSSTGINTTAAIMMESNQLQAQMGFSVACAGDVNRDGYSDVIVGAWLYDNGESNEGVAFVYHGSASGISGTIATTLEANQSASNFGISVAGAGDVNGDGYSDVVVGAEDYDSGQTDEGVVFIYLGSASGINSIAQTFVEANLTLSQFGYSVASAGDVNGDGYSDVIVGAYLFNNGHIAEGSAFIYHGSSSGINSTAAATVESNQPGANLGISVACAGDINGDGYSDVIAGANSYDNVETNEGATYVYFGSAGGINIIAVAILESNQVNAQMGRGVASAGDVNGDGYSDVIAGAPLFNNTENDEGAAFVYHGSASGINTTATTSLQGDESLAQFGFSVSSAGDINGDGFSDVIVGAPDYNLGEQYEGVAFVYHGSATGISTAFAIALANFEGSAFFGTSVASAGDVNGDGFGDVIIGACGSGFHGAAYVYHGSAIGISILGATLTVSQPGAFFGSAVASAGDVNGDGFSDVVVGAPYFDNGMSDEGAAFIYLGSAAGINNIAATTLECNQAFAHMGNAVASAGDINGDGYSDVIIGAYSYSGQGAAFVFHGTATGIPVLSATLTIAQPGADFGNAVSSAGDVNGDAFSDVVVGAPYFDNGMSDEGAAFIYHGSATGVNISASETVESNQANAHMGKAVSSAGDVNGDGYSDVVVGAYQYDNGQNNEGCVFLYHGSAAGVNTTSVSLIESNQADSYLGISVAGAGDVNGDGYSDIIAGANLFDWSLTDQGGAFIYLGDNSGINKRNNLRLYNTDLTSPINSSNFILANFGAGLYSRSFLGRNKGKMVWETRINYNAYSGTPITNSTLFTAQQAVYTDMGLAGVELKTLVDKLLGTRYTKVRARIKYDPVTAITGQVYSPWRNVSSIIDANNLGILPIELISFNAAWLQKGKTARLDFKTDKESGTCCFDIEKSADGFHFYAIGSLTAKNVSGIQSYSFIDDHATGKKQFYRLKIKGIAGQVDYSNIQQLQNNGATEILVFPNPTTDVLQLQLNSAYGKMNIQVINSTGQIVKQLTVAASNRIITIPVQNLPAGKYWLHLQTGSEKQVLQFMKL
ncbi:MAG: FG-GAP-like repeat-containing protein, partial [Ferruginibacter sp.]